MPTTPLPYQPFWCEENIWQLAAHPAPGAGERLVLVITGAAAEVACWNQRAGRPRQPILWDYHVVLAVRSTAWHIWDLDTRLPVPSPASAWLHASFPSPERVRTEFQPRFGVFTAAEWIAGFGSDRSHMRRDDGGWQHPPPVWPPITGAAFTLAYAVDRARSGLSLAAVATRLLVAG